MRTINWPRLLGGGLAAGVVIYLSGLLLRNVVLGHALTTVMAELGRPLGSRHLVLWLVYGLVLGIASLWVYAAIRPMCGAGVTTAVYAAVMVWFFTYLMQAAALVTGELFLAADAEFLQVLMIGVMWGLAELCLATTFGAWLYNEAIESSDEGNAMNTINWRRVTIGGIVVGIVFPLLTSLFDFLSVSLLGVGMNDEEIGLLSLEAIEKLGLADLAGVSVFAIVSVMVFWVVFGIVIGIVAMGLYAAIRPRFGPGLATAVYAGAAFWFLNYVLGGPLLGMTGVSAAFWGLFPAQGMILLAVIHLPAVCLAMMLGARLYREKGDSTAASTVPAV